MRGQMIQDILGEMQTRRIAHEARTAAAEKAAREQDPELARLHTAMVTAQVAAARKRVAHEKEEAQAADQAAAAASYAYESALAQVSGTLPQAAPLCPACQGTGFTGNEEKRLCGCVTQEAAIRMRHAAGIPEDITFQNYDLGVFPSEGILPHYKGSQQVYMGRVAQQLQEWAETFPANAPQNLLLTGGTGLGKTHLVRCIANAVMNGGHEALFTTAYHLNQATLSSIRGQGSLVPYLTTELLLLDDLGCEPMLDKITVETLFLVINERMAASRGTVISTNLSPSEIMNRYGDRIYSRLTNRKETLIFMLEGQDIRSLKHDATQTSQRKEEQQ